MKFKLIIPLFLVLSILSCDSNQISKKEYIKRQTYKIFDSLVQIRRDLHKNPELSGQEKRTSKIVEDYLLNLGLEVKTNIAGYGVVGILNGEKKGRKIAWRADMDAIKIEAKDTVNFRSQKKGVAHMCGHDVHTTIGLGIANVLSNLKDDIKGTVYFIFQPSEETFKGAKAMVDSGLFNEIHPDEIYALHIFPTETGILSTKPNELFAYEKTIKVSVKKKVNREKFKIFFEQIMQSFVRSESKSSPRSLEYLTDSELGLENPNTIYQDYFILLPDIQMIENQETISFKSTFFETDKNRLDSIRSKINNQIMNSEFKDDFISTSYSRGNPTVINDPALTKSTFKTLDSLYNTGKVKPIYGQIPYFNEDFIYYQQRIPGVMFLLGGSNKEKGIIAMPHSPEFAVDEETIKFGVEYFSSLILNRINR